MSDYEQRKHVTEYSRIAYALQMERFPVAVLYADQPPEEAVQFVPGRHGCVISLLDAASKGRIAAFTEETTPCPGGKAGLGFKELPEGLKNFLSTGTASREGEFYKESPELAKEYMTGLPAMEKPACIVFKPLNKLQEADRPLAVIFLVNADQLSGLITLANFDQPTQDNVHVMFGAGCAQAVRYAVCDEQNEKSTCYIGLTDPSARKYVNKDLLSFTIPFHRFLQMENKVNQSFLSHDTWRKIINR